MALKDTTITPVLLLLSTILHAGDMANSSDKGRIAAREVVERKIGERKNGRLIYKGAIVSV